MKLLELTYPIEYYYIAHMDENDIKQELLIIEKIKKCISPIIQPTDLHKLEIRFNLIIKLTCYSTYLKTRLNYLIMAKKV